MTIFQILKTDHNNVKTILKRIEKLDETEQAERLELFEQVKDELLIHLKAEEKAVYLKLKQEDSTRELTFEALEEHGLVQYLLQQIDSVDPEDERWSAKVTVLREVVEHHINDEEKEIFPEMKKSFSSRELGEMAREMEALKKERRIPGRRAFAKAGKRAA
ncbi:MAG TPA: hemerythrin [Bdellovibrionales bacterium]|nr:MAG: hypothetical protein A2Z97_09190 [Bdellovibrionales bacterium GWB1_52_6]OFZ05415.1 MAG: hypothetical protein A2X97_11075 [Bdellovibrionales bacterium GWA1_52_35]OFZ32796.1 MAG: hypothetical protein A2070_12310 [Bdellovibrionales bacterium GWC1_52_8]HAR42292.1 hemerythrin [Bdellovibrionales bacterium]HCM39224.1 hemerythrin [Bdellovibrionales bacterium]